ADIVGEDAEDEAAKRPSQQASHAEDAADPADIADRRVAAQQLGQRRAQHERIKPEISRIERPARPHNEKDGPLIARQAARKADGLLTGCAWHSLPPLAPCLPSCTQPGTSAMLRRCASWCPSHLTRWNCGRPCDDPAGCAAAASVLRTARVSRGRLRPRCVAAP